MEQIPFHILTFGCQMNVRDSSWLSASLSQQGFAWAPLESARIILINTCAVREKPEQKIGNAIRRIHWLTGGNPDVIVGVLGCVAQSAGKKLYAHSPQVRLLAGTDGLLYVPGALKELLLQPQMRLEFLDFSHQYDERPAVEEQYTARSAYINIMQGCDNFCAYCIVPFTRGRQKSRLEKDILAECQRCLDAGVEEITLLGQNVNAYGKDRKDCPSFNILLRHVAQLPGLKRLRFVAAHPKDMDNDTVQAFAELANLCPRLHLPLQAGSNRILQAMRRRYEREEYVYLVESLRKARPDIALSTDLIVGFPGETEAEFKETLEMMEYCAFVSSYSFCYSDRPGTRASLMPDKIPEEVKLERLARLQAMQEQLGISWLASRIGEKVQVLLEKQSPRQELSQNSWQGRDIYGAIINIPIPQGYGLDLTGNTVEVVISEAKRHSLIGHLYLPSGRI